MEKAFLELGKNAKHNMFLNEKVVNLFLVIEGQTLSEACKMANIHYIQGRRYLYYWKNLGLVNMRKPNKSFKIIYTSKGRKVSEALVVSKVILQNNGIQFIG